MDSNGKIFELSEWFCFSSHDLSWLPGTSSDSARAMGPSRPWSPPTMPFRSWESWRELDGLGGIISRFFKRLSCRNMSEYSLKTPAIPFDFLIFLDPKQTNVAESLPKPKHAPEPGPERPEDLAWRSCFCPRMRRSWRRPAQFTVFRSLHEQRQIVAARYPSWWLDSCHVHADVDT